MPSDERAAARAAFVALAVLSAVLLAVRVLAATRVGFGDSEALYASYALHPQPAYLDHPGLVGIVARTLGGGAAPSPLKAHLATAVLATAWPWALTLACRAVGATWARSLTSAVLAGLVPELAIGLFALTPDLLLALAWTLAMALAAAGLRSAPGSPQATAAFASAGVLAGVGASAKLSGLALVLALAATYASGPARPHARTVAPWAGLVAGLLVLVPIAQFEAHAGWPMLQHRLFDTQASAGLSLRNLGALVGGQLVYLSPLVAWLAARAARDAWRDRGDAVGRLLLACFAIPLPPLVGLCLWSRVAEPHWIAPALLALVPAAARATRAPSRRMVFATGAVSAAMVLAVHVWTLVPGARRFGPEGGDPRLDLTNELFGWPGVIDAVREEARAAWSPDAQRGEVVAAGPHWVICAQLDAALRGEWPVGCDTPVRDDFDTWWPRSRWRDAEVVVWVSDTRFDKEPQIPSFAALLKTHALVRSRLIRVDRDGGTVRLFTVSVLYRRAGA